MLTLLLAAPGLHFPTAYRSATVCRARSPAALTEEAAKAAWLAAAEQEPSWIHKEEAADLQMGAVAPALGTWLQSGGPVLTLEAADHMSNIALHEATARGFKPVSVLVLDPAGRTLVAKNMLGSMGLSPEFAHAKASTCLGLLCSSREMGAKYVNGEGIGPKMPQALNMAMIGASADRAMAVFPGGVLCRDAATNTVVCAIAVSGASSDEDEHCAILAAQSIGLLTEPAASRLD